MFCKVCERNGWLICLFFFLKKHVNFKGACCGFSRANKVTLANAHRDVNYSSEAPYLSALLKTTNEASDLRHIGGNGFQNKEKLALEDRCGKIGLNGESWQNRNEGGVVGWSPKVHQRLGEVKWSLWHVKARGEYRFFH